MICRLIQQQKLRRFTPPQHAGQRGFKPFAAA
jgi:hypothetical protein